MKKITSVLHSFSQLIRTHAVAVVFLLIFILIGTGAIALGTREVPPEPATPEITIKTVKAIRYGQSAVSEQATGTVKNLSAVTLVAQTSGPVSQLILKEGALIKKGTVLLRQSTAYAAGNTAVVQRQIAQKNYQQAEAALQNTVEVVAKNRELADKNAENADELRKITERSLEDTRSLIGTAEQVVAKIEADIKAEQETSNDASVIQSLRQQLVSYKSTLNSARAGLRSAEYQANPSSPSNQISGINKDIVYKTTELQLKTAQTQKEVAALNVQVARIMEATTRVAAPFAGKIEKVYVTQGQYLTPGTPVARITGEPQPVLQILVSPIVATRINTEKMITIKHESREYAVPITHVSSTPVSGQLYEVLADLPPELLQLFPEETSVPVVLPIVSQSLDQGYSFIPLSSLFVTSTGRYVLVERDGVAYRVPVETGEVVGSMIEVTSGLTTGDVVILDRRIIDQEKVEVQILPDGVHSMTLELG